MTLGRDRSGVAQLEQLPVLGKIRSAGVGKIDRPFGKAGAGEQLLLDVLRPQRLVPAQQLRDEADQAPRLHDEGGVELAPVTEVVDEMAHLAALDSTIAAQPVDRLRPKSLLVGVPEYAAEERRAQLACDPGLAAVAGHLREPNRPG